MKKILSILLILAMARIGFTFLDSSTADVQVAPVANQEDYFFGVKNAQSNFNQVLALLVGRDGTPGPVGVAGRDGLIGVNGTVGQPGLPGAPGAAGQSGRDGAGVIALSFSGREGSCTNGGIRFTDAAGVVSFACNGTPGPAGAPGSQGAQGAAGTGGSGGTLDFGQGNISISACEADGVIKIDVKKLYTGDDFRLNEFTVGSGTSPGDILDTCAGKTVALYLKVIPGTLKNGGTLGNANFNYQSNDILKCTATLPGASGWPTSSPQFTFTSSSLSCVNQTTNLPAGASLTFDEISSADYLSTVGFEIG